MERVEIALRVDIALMLGKHSPMAHRDPALFDRSFVVAQGLGESKHSNWLARLDESFRKSKEEFVKHFKTKY